MTTLLYAWAGMATSLFATSAKGTTLGAFKQEVSTTAQRNQRLTSFSSLSQVYLSPYASNSEQCSFLLMPVDAYTIALRHLTASITTPYLSFFTETATPEHLATGFPRWRAYTLAQSGKLYYCSPDKLLLTKEDRTYDTVSIGGFRAICHHCNRLTQ